jgi:predicted acetylornithine/succinylornithine family transaminase
MKICLVRGEGSHVWDSEGNEYLDCVAGIAVNNVGHCHPRVVEAIRDQAGRLMHCSNLYYIEPQAELAERLVKMLPEGLDKVFFCNSGTEAVEAAIKLTRRATGKPEIIAAKGSFHGRTLGALSLTGQEKYRVPFEPLVPGAKFVKFGDIEALASSITEDTGGIVLEPVQGEGGIIPALPEYLSSVKSLCEERGIILTFDEVQAGMGRTGSFLACQQMGVTPHIVAMAKGLGGGFPIGAMAASSDVMDKFHPSDHASTFGGNPLACSAANAALQVLVEEKLIQRASELGSWALEEMEIIKARHPDLVESVRGLGLMLGMEMSSEDIAIKVFDECLDEFILVNRTAGKVIRLVPPLVVTKDELSRAFSAIDRALNEI